MAASLASSFSILSLTATTLRSCFTVNCCRFIILMRGDCSGGPDMSSKHNYLFLYRFLCVGRGIPDTLLLDRFVLCGLQDAAYKSGLLSRCGIEARWSSLDKTRATGAVSKSG